MVPPKHKEGKQMAEQQTEGKKGQSPGDPRQQRQTKGIGVKIMTGLK